MSDFVKKFREVVEKSSGALSFGLIQSLVMIGAIAKLSSQTGVTYFILFSVAFIATMGVALCILSILSVINEVAGKHNYMKFLLGILLYPVFVGVLLSAYLSISSIAS